MFIVCICTLNCSERILRYLAGILHLGIWYLKASSSCLLGHFDANFIGSGMDQKSIRGTCQFVGHFVVLHYNKKWNSVALSIRKVK